MKQDRNDLVASYYGKNLYLDRRLLYDRVFVTRIEVFGARRYPRRREIGQFLTKLLLIQLGYRLKPRLSEPDKNTTHEETN